MTNRRAFLFGIAGAASLIAAPKLFVSTLPVLWGDGAHDDTAALRALFSGQPIRLASGDSFAPHFERDGGRIELLGGVYLTDGPVRIGKNTTVRRATFLLQNDDGAVLFESSGCAMSECVFASPGFHGLPPLPTFRTPSL